MLFKKSPRSASHILIFILLLSTSLILVTCWPSFYGENISGHIFESDGKTTIEGALISLRSSDIQTRSDQIGFYKLRIPDTTDNPEITAWAPGYYIASYHPESENFEHDFILRDLPEDNPSYTWIDPSPGSSEDACANCHPMIYPQWASNAHGGAIGNERFFSFYNGTDTSGNPTSLSGYLVDFPATAGNCATCHSPGAAIDEPFTTNMNEIRGDVISGIHCDFCHKAGKIYLNPADLQVYDNVPGILAMGLLRPPEGDQIFIGPYPDIHDPDTYNPTMSESEFCATCHQFSFWGTEIYNSYGEWLASSYAEEGITCQDCHMPPSGDAYFALPDQGGLAHPPEDIPSHFQLGLKDTEFMQTTLEMKVKTTINQDKLTLEVTITNTNAGHHVPTDHPGRHLILLVEAVNQEGEQLPLLSGPRIPEWAGDLGGNPGTIYAKILEDALTGEYPVVNYWNPTLIHSDNRIPANQTQNEDLVFQMPGESVEINIQILFRRLFQPIAEDYGWDLDEIIMAQETFVIEK